MNGFNRHQVLQGHEETAIYGEQKLSQLPDFHYLLTPLHQLHSLVFRSPRSSTPSDRAVRGEMIRSRTDELVATVLDQVLENYIQSRNVHIDKFRASVVYPFVDNDVSWPILEWTEGRDTEVLAIFEIDFYSEAAECSWLMHHGFESDLKLEDQPWKQTNVTWSVTNMSHLKTLFRVAQHILGILEWPAEDAHQLYCQEDRRDWSDEEYVSLTTCELTVADSVVRYGRLLFDHFSKIESLDTVFDAVLPALKHFSTEQVTEYADGTHVSRYYGSVF